jgi:hypothetical protein
LFCRVLIRQACEDSVGRLDFVLRDVVSGEAIDTFTGPVDHIRYAGIGKIHLGPLEPAGILYLAKPVPLITIRLRALAEFLGDVVGIRTVTFRRVT